MKERPILFSAPMVRALLNCTKSQTRRVVKQSLERLGDGDWYAFDHKGVNYRVNARHTTVAAWAHLLQFCPYGAPGDRLWVREAFDPIYGQCPPDRIIEVDYRADWEPNGKHWRMKDEMGLRRWKPSIHMPRDLSRILLEIVSVRVERLQDISRTDAIAEGVDLPPLRADEPIADPCSYYRALWESINGPGSWDANPWVWVVEFKQGGAA